jgi:hypothetical protein
MDLGSGKVLASSVDTLWRWQLQPDFDPPTPLETLMGNVIRYMAPEPGSRAGSVNVALTDPTPSLGQTVTMSTLLLEENYDPKRLADLAVRVKKPDGQSMTLYPRDLNDRPGLYEDRVLADQPGDWTVTAALNKTNRTMRFVVRGAELKSESINWLADLCAMYCPNLMRSFMESMALTTTAMTLKTCW